MKKLIVLLCIACMAGIGFAAGSVEASSSSGFTYKQLIEYPAPKPILRQAKMETLKYKEGKVPVVALMPAATEFPYIMAVCAGFQKNAEKMGMETFILAPQSGSDINGQMGMLQDVIAQNIDAIVINTHDENAAAPLLKRAVEKGIMVVNYNSDSIDFPAPIHAVVGYTQRSGNVKQAKWMLEKYKGMDIKLGIIEGLPGYHSTERVGGFVDGIDNASNVKIIASLSGNWNTEGGNIAAMDLLQAHPEINVFYAANDMEAMGAIQAIQALGRKDILIFANDGNTEYLEEIARGRATATLNTQPFIMGQIAAQVVADGFAGKFPGGFAESPSIVAHEENIIELLRDEDKLLPKPSKKY